MEELKPEDTEPAEFRGGRYRICGGFFLLMMLSTVTAQQKDYFFYRDYDYGSEALYNPVFVFLNGSMDSYQILDQHVRPSTLEGIPWSRGSTSVWKSITSPLPVISAFGWDRFLRQEVFPTSLDPNEAQYVPNYMLHLIGGGMDSRKLTEWFDAHDYPAPFALGAFTDMVYEFLNEAVENGKNIYPNEDCIPDILIFQTGGILLFSSDAVCRFFSETLSLNDWSNPVALSFAPLAFRNAGQNFVMKFGLTESRSTSLIMVFGDFSVFGLSFKNHSDESISVAAGIASIGTKVLPVVNGVPSNTVATGFMMGAYYDRSNSLLASAVYSDCANNRVRVSIYPGLIQNEVFNPGVFLSVGDEFWTAGLTLRVVPFGLAVQTPR